MKSANRKPFIALVGGIVLLACMLSEVVGQQQRSKRQPAAKSEASSTAALTAPLKAKLSADQVIVHKQAAVPYVPFTLADLKDPKSGKAPTETTVLKLPNGKEVPAGTYLKAINDLEQKFNNLGYSLKSTQEKVTIQELAYNKPQLTQEAQAVKAFKPVSAKAQALATSPASLQQEYETEVKALKATTTSAKAATTEEPEGAKGAKGAKGAGRTKKSEAAKAAAATDKAGESTTTSTKSAMAGKGAAGLGIDRPMQPFSTTKSFDNKWGDPSIFGAEVSGSLTFKGDANSAALSGAAKATGSVLGNSEDLAVATADLNAPRTGNLTANVKITVLGVDQVVLNESQSVNFNKQDTYSRSLPDSFKVEYQFYIGPIPIHAVVGVKGSVTLPYYVAMLPGSSVAWMIPTVQGSVYAQAGIGIDYEDTGVVVGVETDLTLLSNKLTLAGGASEGTDTTGPFVNYWLTSRDDLTALKGALSVYVKIEVYGHTVHTFSEDFFTYTNGITGTYTPVDGGEKVYLHPISSVQQAH